MIVHPETVSAISRLGHAIRATSVSLAWLQCFEQSAFRGRMSLSRNLGEGKIMELAVLPFFSNHFFFFKGHKKVSKYHMLCFGEL